MTDWGLVNGHLDPWDFKHPGWLNERLTAHIISPVKDSLVCEVLAWTPSTPGTVTAKAYNLVLPERPTQYQLDVALAKERANMRGRIVLVGKPRVVPVNLNPPPKRVATTNESNASLILTLNHLRALHRHLHRLP